MFILSFCFYLGVTYSSLTSVFDYISAYCRVGRHAGKQVLHAHEAFLCMRCMYGVC